ncbi:MAG: Dyp-type peroxidase [Acidimicrobiales bacterium]
MAVPQPGIFALGTRAHHHLQFDLVGDRGAAMDRVLAVRGGVTSVRGVNLVTGLGPAMLPEIAADHRPVSFSGFETIEGADGFAMPADQHDVWMWVHGSATDAVLTAARLVADALAPDLTLAAEQPSFVHGASLDLTGFEDGTENPPIDEAVGIATLPAGSAGAGGSIALLQRWRHDLASFDALPLGQKERVFGRTLAGSIELDDAVQSPAAHVARVVIDDEHGDELEVFRRSTPFGGVRKHGLMFVAFSADQDRLRRMLDRMAGREDGIRDHLTEFSTPSGCVVLRPARGGAASRLTAEQRNRRNAGRAGAPQGTPAGTVGDRSTVATSAGSAATVTARPGDRPGTVAVGVDRVLHVDVQRSGIAGREVDPRPLHGCRSAIRRAPPRVADPPRPVARQMSDGTLSSTIQRAPSGPSPGCPDCRTRSARTRPAHFVRASRSRSPAPSADRSPGPGRRSSRHRCCRASLR